MPSQITPELASHFARIALSHVDREYPGVIQHVLEAPAQALSPRILHPAFYGSFDWHSCVHSHWLLARLLARHPALPEGTAIRARFDAAFSQSAIAGEIAYFEPPSRKGFERPYGWAWVLELDAELRRSGAVAGAWETALRPLAEMIASRLAGFLARADYPVRAGVHSNTAFALILAGDYAQTAADDALAAIIIDVSRRWYAADADCQAWEPSGDDFLSPALIEVELMRRMLDAAEFTSWLRRFLPRLAAGEPHTLFAPARVSDRSDGKTAHLDGLNLSRAWCWRGIAGALSADDPMCGRAESSAKQHLDASLPYVAGDYMGEHWLASFAVLALEGL